MRDTRGFVLAVSLGVSLTVGVAACSSSPRHQTVPTTIQTAPATTTTGVTTATTGATTATTGATTSTTAAALPIAKFSNWSGIKPSVIYFSGDAGNIVSGIVWSVWASDVAIGQGEWGYDDCNPNCAQGHVTDYSTMVRLSNVSGGQFTLVTEVQSGPYAHTQSFTLPSTFIGAGA
jgi:hypothetical protein